MVGQKSGSIVVISSTSALGNRGQANYSAAKAGIQGLAKTLSIELGRFGIRVNCVAPGFIATAMTEQTAGADGNVVRRIPGARRRRRRRCSGSGSRKTSPA